MGSNTFGKIFQLHAFGESHGPAMGAVIEGMPAGLPVSLEALQKDVNRRKPGQSAVTTSRAEEDQVEILSGVFEEKTLGTPISCIVRNSGQRSKDYDNMPDRIGHADSVWREKYRHVDRRGGGRSSGRETISRVIAGHFAKCFVKYRFPNIRIDCFADQISNYRLTEEEEIKVTTSPEPIDYIDQFPTRWPSEHREVEVQHLLTQAKSNGQSFGGSVKINMNFLPIGLGEPVFAKLKSDLASAMMSIGATIGVEFGAGFDLIEREGSDLFKEDQMHLLGGLSGGMSNGDVITMRVAFKPTSSVKDVAQKGRHDPCIVPRAVIVVESMAWLVLADQILRAQLSEIGKSPENQ